MAETSNRTVTKRIAVVTGANKGIGFEICRRLASNGIMVVLTARDEKRGNEAVNKLKAEGLADVAYHPLDVQDPASVASLVEFLKTQFGKLDILVNNAGITGTVFAGAVQNLKLDFEKVTGPAAASLKKFVKQTYETAENCLGTNYYGVKRVSKALIPILQQSTSPKIVNVSSELGQLKLIQNERARNELGDVEGLTEERVDKVVEEFLSDVKEDLVESKDWPVLFSAYIVSKAALNAYTRVLAKEHPEIVVNAVNPGYTSTDMNQNTGVLTVEEGAEGPVRIALMLPGGPSGLYFDRTEAATF